jgi:two-component system cell cycle sensor histidine kinase/response regulator CckA
MQAKEFVLDEAARSMVDATPCMIWFSGSDACRTFFNRAWLEFRGRSLEQEMHGGWIEGVHADDQHRCIESYRSAFAAQRSFEMEYRLQRKDGVFRRVIDKGSPWINQDKNIRGYVGSTVEIAEPETGPWAEEKATASAVAQGEDQFRLLVSSVQDYAIFVLDTEGVIVTWNTGAERIKGYKAGEIIGKHFSCFYTAEEQQAGKPGLQLKTAAVRGRVEDEGWRVRKDGSKVWANVVITAMHDRSGNLSGFGKVTRDLTERKFNEEMLQKSNDELESRVRERTAELVTLNEELRRSISEQLRSDDALKLRDRAIQAVSQGILITDPNQQDNPIIYASPGMERLTGYRADEIMGRNCRFFQGRNTDPETINELGEAIRAGRECSVEILNYRKDMTPFWNALSVTPVRDEQGGLLNFIGVQADVTERRELENQVRQSQKMEAIGQLAGGVAHDFNNLLTVISGYSEILLGMLGWDDPQRMSVKAISEASERAAGLTRQLLSFSRKTVLEPQVLNLNTVVQGAETMLRRMIGEDILLIAVLDPRISSVKVDPDQMVQVLMNLAVNTRDAMPQGGRLTIETMNIEFDEAYVNTHIEVQAGRYVLLTISDTGIGMTPEVRSRIFEPFFTTKGVGQGTGLGLSVVHGIVKQSNGQIGVYSEVGVGTTFKIYLPAREEEATTSIAVDPRNIGRGTETVLLVEDEDAVRELALLALQTKGYTVLSAAIGRQAMEIVRKHSGRIDILVTDVVMPEMSGRQLAEVLQPWFPEMKVLYLSGYTEDAVVRHGILQAEVAFLQKPYTPMGLLRKVRQVLNMKNDVPSCGRLPPDKAYTPA